MDDPAANGMMMADNRPSPRLIWIKMHSSAIAIYVILGLIEFVVINRALRDWMGKGGLMPFLLATAATYVPLIGGVIALVAAITVLEWPWWLSAVLFVGGSIALALTGSFAVLLGGGSLF